ncbi:MFS transporter [Streptomyces sp. CA-294286]|uniref:MFS transporter n=1 Tax=Streptomyces sp. CA-294286 TaxID=3240070 RepID=UPI003D8AE8E1
MRTHIQQQPPESPRTTTAVRRSPLPLSALLALATAVFVTSLTETLPAGLLPAMSADLGVSQAATGQTVTVYAIGTALTAIPLTAATATWRRKRLLLTAMAGFAVANTVTALSTDFVLTMTARFAAGVAAGLAWALLAGYARRMAPAHLQGKALAIAMAGIPVALSLGVPTGTYLGKVLTWEAAFLVMTALTVALLAWIAAGVPDYPGAAKNTRTAKTARTAQSARTSSTAPTGDADSPSGTGGLCGTGSPSGTEGLSGTGRPGGTTGPGCTAGAGVQGVLGVLRVPGVVPVLFVTLVFVLAHTVLYTFVAPFLTELGMGDSVDVVLLVFGAASLLSIWIVGARINRRLRALMIASTLLIAVAASLLALLNGSTAAVYAAVALWGLGWGGAPTLLQTAAGDAAGTAGHAAADATQAMLVTLWNAAMAAGGVVGGLLLGVLGSASIPWSVLALLVPVLLAVLAARSHGFPERRTAAAG